MAEIAHRLGREALAEVAVAAKPDTILRSFRELVAVKFDGSACRQSVGRPRVEKTIEDLIVRMALILTERDQTNDLQLSPCFG